MMYGRWAEGGGRWTVNGRLWRRLSPSNTLRGSRDAIWFPLRWCAHHQSRHWEPWQLLPPT